MSAFPCALLEGSVHHIHGCSHSQRVQVRGAETAQRCCPVHAAAFRRAYAAKRGHHNEGGLHRLTMDRGRSSSNSCGRREVRCQAGSSAERLTLPEPVISWPRTFLTDFQLTEEALGKGSFGTVKRAVHRATQREAAVKIIPKLRGEVAAERILHRIREEVDFLEHVQERPEAVQLLGVYEDDGFVYIVTELCRGGDLDAYLRARGRLNEWEVAKIAHDILQVLCECHRQNICYADIKPANFLLKRAVPAGARLDAPPQVKVADFGCSQRVLQGEKLHKRTGTPLYMAPEIFMSHFGVESDMWSLGMMLYQCIAGHLPFWRTPGDARSPYLIMSAILSEEVPFEGPAWAKVSTDTISFIEGLLDRDYNTRLTAREALQHPWLVQQCSLEACQVVWD